jgi:hypothetical protein
MLPVAFHGVANKVDGRVPELLGKILPSAQTKRERDNAELAAQAEQLHDFTRLHLLVELTEAGEHDPAVRRDIKLVNDFITCGNDPTCVITILSNPV